MTLKSSTKKEKQNVVAYALSRKYEDVEALFCAISIIQSNLINEASDEWKKDEEDASSNNISRTWRRRKNHIGTWSSHKNKNLRATKLINFRVSHEAEELTR